MRPCLNTECELKNQCKTYEPNPTQWQRDTLHTFSEGNYKAQKVPKVTDRASAHCIEITCNQFQEKDGI